MSPSEWLARLLERGGTTLVAAAAIFVGALVLWAIARAAREPKMPAAERRTAKEEIVRMMRGEYKGMTVKAISERLGIEVLELKPLLVELVEDRFLVAGGDARDPVYRMRGLETY